MEGFGVITAGFGSDLGLRFFLAGGWLLWKLTSVAVYERWPRNTPFLYLVFISVIYMNAFLTRRLFGRALWRCLFRGCYALVIMF